MEALSALIAFVTAPLDLRALLALFEVVPILFTRSDLYVWLLIVFPALRFGVPPTLLWIMQIVRPSWIRPLPSPRPKNPPLVSVVIAGRNESAGLVRTLQSVLRCGYPNLDVIYVDDGSDDDSLLVAQQYARQFTGRPGTLRLRIFAAPQRNGKPSALNFGIRFARGEFIAIIDADCELQFGSIDHWLQEFADPRVGAVAANLRVRNANASLATRLQECEYALNVTLSRFWRGRTDLLAIVPGAGGMFRTSVLRSLGGFDTGLGDDTDMTLRIRKQRWVIRFAIDAVVWTDVPETWRALVRQRVRWERNMVKIRLRKHRDLLLPWRYGMRNMLITLDIIVVRLVLPAIAVALLLWLAIDGADRNSALLTHMYWLTVAWGAMKLVMARDIASTPRTMHLGLAVILPLYRAILRVFLLSAIVQEFLRIRARHAYVPQHIWRASPHW